MHSLIQFSILLFAFEFCYAIFQFYNSIVQSSNAVSNPTISLQILLFTFLILLSYAIMNSLIQFASALFATPALFLSLPTLLAPTFTLLIMCVASL